MFSATSSVKLKLFTSQCQHDATATGITLICTLLVIGGVELNPGPSSAKDERHSPGPSSMDAALMDVMEALRVTQLQIDHLSTQVLDLINLVKGLNGTQRTYQPEHEEDMQCK